MVNTPLSPTIRTVQLLEQLVGAEGEPFYGGETSEGIHQIGTKRRIATTTQGGEIAAAVYDMNRKARAIRGFENTISDELGMAVHGVRAQIIFSQDSGKSECTGDIYVTDEQAICSMYTRVHPVDLGSTALLECFDTANEIGVGDVWTTSLLRMLRGETPGNRLREVTSMSDPAIEYLNARLSMYVDDNGHE